MCHIELSDTKRAAAIIRDSAHSPRLWVSADAVQPSDPPIFQEEDKIGDWRIFTIPNDARIIFDGLKKGKVAKPPAPAVARISELIPRFIPIDEGLATQQHAWVRGYIEYSGGTTFTVTCYHEDSARFTDDSEYYCRARELLFTTESITPTVTITDLNSNRSLVVKGDATIAFTQLDKDPNSHDYKLYPHLSKGTVKLLEMQRKKNDCPTDLCTLPHNYFLELRRNDAKGGPLVSVSVECLSTQWP
jgi:hypothetical protein